MFCVVSVFDLLDKRRYFAPRKRFCWKYVHRERLTKNVFQNLIFGDSCVYFRKINVFSGVQTRLRWMSMEEIDITRSAVRISSYALVIIQKYLNRSIYRFWKTCFDIFERLLSKSNRLLPPYQQIQILQKISIKVTEFKLRFSSDTKIFSIVISNIFLNLHPLKWISSRNKWDILTIPRFCYLAKHKSYN